MNTSLIDFALYDTESSIIIVDGSSYNPDLPVTEPLVCIVPPNYVTKYSESYTPLTNKVVNPSFFNFPCNLEDGIYKIKLSVCPSTILFKEKNYLRTYNLEKKLGILANEAIRVNKDTCLYTDLILQLFVAKSIANCEPDRAMIIYNSVNDSIKPCTNC